MKKTLTFSIAIVAMSILSAYAADTFPMEVSRGKTCSGTIEPSVKSIGNRCEALHFNFEDGEIVETKNVASINRLKTNALDAVSSEGSDTLYYLMGIDADWAVGILMEKNTKAANLEYMLLNVLIDGDTVKVKDSANNWYGTVKDGVTVSHSSDLYGNVILPNGVYNFYFGVSAKALWIEEVAVDTNVVLSESLLTSESFGRFVGYSVAGDQVWSVDAVYGAKMSGFNNDAQKSYANEDWLISPAMDLSQAIHAYFVFDHTRGPKSVINVGVTEGWYSVWVSNDYTDGAPSTATWTEITDVTHTATAWTYVSSGTLSIPTAFLTENTRIAFKYQSADETSATWEVKNLEVSAIEPAENYDPTDLTAVHNGYGGVTFNWTAKTDSSALYIYNEDGYFIYDTWVVSGDIPTTVTGFWEGTFIWGIRAYKNGIFGDLIQGNNFVVEAAAPRHLQTTITFDNVVTFSYETISDSIFLMVYDAVTFEQVVHYFGYNHGHYSATLPIGNYVWTVMDKSYRSTQGDAFAIKDTCVHQVTDLQVSVYGQMVTFSWKLQNVPAAALYVHDVLNDTTANVVWFGSGLEIYSFIMKPGVYSWRMQPISEDIYFIGEATQGENFMVSKNITEYAPTDLVATVNNQMATFSWTAHSPRVGILVHNTVTDELVYSQAYASNFYKSFTQQFSAGTYRWSMYALGNSWTDVISDTIECANTFTIAETTVDYSLNNLNVDVNGNNVTFTWNATTVSDSVRVQIQDIHYNYRNVIDTFVVNNGSCTIENLPDATYRWKLEPYNAAHQQLTPSSYGDDFTVQTVVDYAPTGLKVDSPTRTVTFTWKLHSEKVKIEVVNVTTTAVIVSQILADTVYSYTFEEGTYAWSLAALNASNTVISDTVYGYPFTISKWIGTETEAINENSLFVYACNRTLYIKNAAAAEISVFDVVGHLIARNKTQVAVPYRGVYIVKVGAKTTKVLVP